MGNRISFTSYGSVCKGLVGGTKVIFPSGEIRRLYKPTKAAELMLESPNYFVVNAKSLQIGRRFSALSADEDLEMGGVYVLLPMKRLNLEATAADMGALFVEARSAAKRVSKILPECGVDVRIVQSNANCGASKLELDDFQEISTLEVKHKVSKGRSKKPSLETIVEEPICLSYGA